MLSIHGHSETSDQDLIKNYKASGDLIVLGQLYDRYMSLVYSVCLKYLKDREESKDAVMQIFEKLIQTLREHEVEHFKSWLYITARNYCLMQLRSAKGRKFEDISSVYMENDTSLHLDSEPEMETNLVKLEDCIKKLAVEQQHCVQLFYLQQKCYKDITILTGFDMNSVKSHIQNGKRNLKICMGSNG